MSKFKITLKSDLIKIYKNNQFKEFVEAYEQLENDCLEFSKLSYDFERKYFPEFITYQTYNLNGLSEEEFEKLTQEEKNKYLVPLEDGVKNREHLSEDPQLSKFMELADKVCTKTLNKRFRGLFEYNKINDEIAENVFNKTLGRLRKRFVYTTTYEEAENLGITEIMNFIKEHPQYPFLFKNMMLEKNGEKLNKIRTTNNVEIDNPLFASQNYGPKIIKHIESGKGMPDANLLKIYAQIGCMSYDDLLKELCLEEIHREHKYGIKKFNSVILELNCYENNTK